MKIEIRDRKVEGNVLGIWGWGQRLKLIKIRLTGKLSKTKLEKDRPRKRIFVLNVFIQKCYTNIFIN